MRVPFIQVEPVYDNEQTIVGTMYADDAFLCVDTVDDFVEAIDHYIDDYRSIILYRQDVREFADIICGKEAFKQIKTILRSKYTVLKLKYNPRTQEFCGSKTAFIIHQK